MRRIFKNSFYYIAGVILIIVGIVGLVLPLVPGIFLIGLGVYLIIEKIEKKI